MRIFDHLVPGAVLALVPLLPAQGTYTAFGQGCPGTCPSANGTATAHQNRAHNANIFALGLPANSATMIVRGFELLTQTYNRSTPLTIATQIYYADSSGKPTGTPKASGTMTIGTTANWYRTTFSTPLIVPANQKFFVSYTSVANQMVFPFASTGSNTSHFWHSPTATAWNGAAPNGFVSQRWAWRLVCAGNTVPVLGNSGVPTIGTTFSVGLSNARTSAPAILAVGVSNTLWNTTKLPWDLSVLGAQGCNLLVSLEFQIPVQTDWQGKFSQNFAVPNDSGLKGLKFYNQYGVGDPGANVFGVVFSNGGAGVVQ